MRRGSERSRNRKENALFATVLIFSLIILSNYGINNNLPNLTTSTSNLIPAHPRSSAQASSSNQVNVYGLYSSEPAPMGITDYGIGSSGAYQYSTSSFIGSASFSSLAVQNATGYPWMGFQLNVNLQFASISGAQYTYWVQNVAQIDTSQDSIFILDNVWNSSANSATMTSSGIQGRGVVANCNCSNNVSFYYAYASGSLLGNGIYFKLPMDLLLQATSTLSSQGYPQVSFSYNDGYGWQTYDTVTFPVKSSTALDSNFLVNGFSYKPDGTYYDAEMILAGPGNGATTGDVQSTLRMGLQFYNGHNYQDVYNAYNFGSDTAETISNVVSSGTYLYANGSLRANLAAASGSLGVLYTQSQVSLVTIRTAISSGILYVENTTFTSSKGAGYPFSGGEATITLNPGTYTFYVYSSSGVAFGTQSQNVLAGQSITLNIGTIPLTFGYSASGGNGYQPPTLTYFSNGVQETVSLSTAPQTFYADQGTTWSVTTILTGSSSTERWITNQTTSGTASTQTSTVFNYSHQYYVTFSASPQAEGSVTPTGSAWYNAGQIFSISASAVAPYFLEVWNASTTSINFTNSTSPSTTVTINGAGNVVAELSLISISLGENSATITQGSSIQLSGLVRGGGGNVNLAVSGLPSGAVASLSSNSITTSTGGTSFTLTVTTQVSTTPGVQVLTVSAGGATFLFTLTIRQAVPLTLSYSVQGQSSGASPAIIRYTYNGTSSQAALSSTPTTIYVDANSGWSVSSTLPGSTSTQRWATNQTNSGNVSSSTTLSFIYYEQYSIDFGYTIVGGGSAYTAPNVTYREFGSNSSTTAGTRVWVDTNSNYSYINPLIGSSSSERWVASNSSASGIVSSSASPSPNFYHQFALSAMYSTIGGGSPPSSPSLNYHSLGNAASRALSTTASAFWADALSTYNVSSVISSSQGERWNITSSNTGTVTSSETLNPSYAHQYYLTIRAVPQSGGSVNRDSEWVNAGSSVSINATPKSNWKFEFWNGTGSGSYSGSSGVASLSVNSPLNESAVFYPGITISSSGQGSVSYSDGKTSGTVQSGSQTVYVAPGSTLTLTANPSSFFYSLGSWSGAVNGSSSTTNFRVSAPASISAQFSYDITTIGAIIVGIVALAAALGLILRSRRH